MQARALLAIAAMALAAPCATAFTTHAEGATTAVEALAASPRWDANSAAHADGGEPGLGGGIEFALHPDFCPGLAAILRDEPGEGCDRILRVIRDALAPWEHGNPAIGFSDVSGRARPQPGPGGAEIDFLLLPSTEVFGGTAAWRGKGEPATLRLRRRSRGPGDPRTPPGRRGARLGRGQRRALARLHEPGRLLFPRPGAGPGVGRHVEPGRVRGPPCGGGRGGGGGEEGGARVPADGVTPLRPD